MDMDVGRRGWNGEDMLMYDSDGDLVGSTENVEEEYVRDDDDSEVRRTDREQQRERRGGKQKEMSKEDERGGASFLRGRFDFPSVGEMIAFVPEARDSREGLEIIEQSSVPLHINAQYIQREREPFDSGCFGDVYRGNVGGTRCAIKKIKTFNSKSPEIERFLDSETQIMHAHHHPNLLELLCCCLDSSVNPPEVHLVMPLMRANLRTYLLENRKTISDNKKMDFCTQILTGMAWLHSQSPPILHLDLKLENILVDEHEVVKICDFGLAGILLDEKRIHGQKAGNLVHTAPEVISNRLFTTKADIYGCGILIWEVLRGGPWSSIIHRQVPSEKEARRKLERGELRPPLNNFQEYLPALCPLLESMWHPLKDNRPSIGHILTNEWPQLRAQVWEMSLGRYISAPNIRQFWMKSFGDKLSVPFDEFSEHFCNFIRFLNPECNFLCGAYETAALKVSLSVSLTPSSLDDSQVDVEQFGNMMDAFGPPDTQFFNRMFFVCAAPWFYPGTKGVDERMRGQRDGSYIIRYSDQRNIPFSITVLVEGKLRSARVYKENSHYYVTDKEEGKHWGETVEELLNAAVIQRTLRPLYANRLLLSPSQLLFIETVQNGGYLNSSTVNL